MGKKRHAGIGPNGASVTDEVDPADAKLNVRTWEDVADSEDEFHINRDKILLDEEPSRKRQRLQEEKDAFLEPSDEEVLNILEEDSDFDEEDGGYEDEDLSEEEEGVSLGKINAVPKPRGESDSESEKGDEDEEREEGWGTSKRDYYNADQIETEADALEEEQEALRLQKKQLEDMTEADYGFDENEWLGAEKGEELDEEEETVVREVLPDLQITDEMTPEDRSKILEARYPEFKPLAKEFLSLQSQHEDLMLAEAATQAVLKNRKQSDDSGEVTVVTIKRSALGGYLAALSMYFAVLSSGSKSTSREIIAKAPAELRDHPIMETLMQCRTLWEKVKDVPVPEPAELVEEDVDETMNNDALPANDAGEVVKEKPKKKRKSKAEKAANKARQEAEARRAQEARRIKQRLASIDGKVTFKPSGALTASKPTQIASDNNSDFGEETTLTAHEAAEKARRKKGLRFYTSQIVQKSNKRENAGRDAGGDADIPYRERLKDRQARLNAEAEARGRKKQRSTDQLGGSSDSEADARISRELRADGDEAYYDLVASKAKAKKDAKAAKAAAHKEAAAQGAMVREVEEIGADGRRNISYQIEKNKGLAPKRKKDVRNPRVKKRKKFEEKKKKLGSIRPVYKGGEGRGGYGGELTGIKTGLVKSRKL